MGPNGSGKSNVVDAIRWALGEQSVRDLRGQRSEDIIYAGARKVLGMAEVVLTFQGRDVEASSHADLSVTRRVFRGGESEYRVNGDRARLRDLTAALRSIGIDQPRHVVVNQGMADSLLACTPAERRALLEQAAGLSGYRVQRDDAQTKLAGTQHNIETIVTVLAELEPRLRLLKRQAKAVRERDEAAAALSRMLALWYGHLWAAAGESIRTLEDRGSQLASTRASLKARIADCEGAMSAYEEQREQWQETMDSLAGQARLHERETVELRHSVERLQAERKALERSIGALAEEAETLRAARAEAEERLAVAARNVEVLDGDTRNLRAEIGGLDAHLSRAADMVRTVTETRVALERDLQVLGREEAALRGQVQAVKRETDLAHSDLHRVRTALDRLEKDAVELQSELACAEEKAERCTRAERALDVRVDEQTETLEVLSRRHEKVQRLRRRLRGQVTEAGSIVGRLTASLRDSERDVTGQVHLSLSVRTGWEAAVSAAFSRWLPQDVPSDRPTFLAWRAGLQALLPEVVTWLEDYVSGTYPDWSPLIAVLAAPDEAAALQAWRCLAGHPSLPVGAPSITIVVPSGRVLGPFGWETGLVDEGAAAYLRIKSQYAEWHRRLKLREHREQRIQEENRISGERLESARGYLMRVRNERAEASRGRVHATSRVEAVRRQLERLSEDRRRYEVQLTELVERMPALDSQVRDLAAKLTIRERAGVEQRARLDEARQAEERERAEHHKLQERRGEALSALTSSSAHLEAQRSLRESLQHDQIRRDADLERYLTRRNESSERLAAIEKGLQQAEHAYQESLLRQQETRRKAEEWRGSRPVPPIAGERIAGLRVELERVVAEHEHVLARLAEAVERRRTLEGEIRAELHIDPGALPREVAVPPAIDEIKRLRARASSYPDADTSVLAECEESVERDRYLRQQLDDLRAAATQLDEIMRAADTEMQSRFRGAFSRVSEEFARVFSLMLPGGHAELIPTGEHDQGVEVRAQLPGKRIRSSAAFSGGERSLVATSLLFGVLRIRPVPFCILDEVDAALDESNVDRYLGVLRETSMRTQMIVVTHNRATMAAADVLYGLTMDDAGSSRVLSVDLRASERAG